MHHILKSGFGDNDGAEIKTDVVLPWETPAGTNYQTERLVDVELEPYVLELEPYWVGAITSPTGIGISPNAGGDAFGYHVKEILTAFGIEEFSFVEGERYTILESEYEIDGIPHKYTLTLDRLSSGAEGSYRTSELPDTILGVRLKTGETLRGWYRAEQLVTPSPSDISVDNSSNTSGANVADEWIDVYYYYSMKTRLINDVEIEDEE